MNRLFKMTLAVMIAVFLSGCSAGKTDEKQVTTTSEVVRNTTEAVTTTEAETTTGAETTTEIVMTTETETTECVIQDTVSGEVTATQTLETVSPYTAYSVNTGSGSVTIRGYVDQSASTELMTLLNSYRVENGLSMLATDGSLNASAELRIHESMYFFSHTIPDGTRFSTVLPQYTRCGENLAKGQASASEAMNSWKNSDVHRANMLNPDYTYAATLVFVGEDGIRYYIQEFITK